MSFFPPLFSFPSLSTLFLYSFLPSPSHFPFPSFSVLSYVKDACYVNVMFNEWLEGNKKEKKKSFEKKITSLNSLVNQICILLSLSLKHLSLSYSFFSFSSSFRSSQASTIYIHAYWMAHSELRSNIFWCVQTVFEISSLWTTWMGKEWSDWGRR